MMLNREVALKTAVDQGRSKRKCYCGTRRARLFPNRRSREWRSNGSAGDNELTQRLTIPALDRWCRPQQLGGKPSVSMLRPGLFLVCTPLSRPHSRDCVNQFFIGRPVGRRLRPVRLSDDPRRVDDKRARQLIRVADHFAGPVA